MENLIAATRKVLSNYVAFEGRAPRAEYWWWILAYVLLMIVCSLIDELILKPILGLADFQPLSMLLGLGVFLPNLAVSVRRLHDTGRSGWWLLLLLIPIVGALVILWFQTRPSEAGANRFGLPQPWRLPAA